MKRTRKSTLHWGLLIIVTTVTSLLWLCASARQPGSGAGSSLVQASTLRTVAERGTPSPGEMVNGIEVEPQLLAHMRQENASGYLIYFREHPDLSSAFDMLWQERGRFVVNTLQETAAQSQKRVRALLDGQQVKYQAFWVDNVIVVESSGPTTFSRLLNFPEIETLRTRRRPLLHRPAAKADAPVTTAAVAPNISHVGAEQVWSMGFTGEDIVVANVDTGVRYSHEALQTRYRGNLDGGSVDHNYSWWDPYGQYLAVPADDNGHGSHTMGIMVGDDGSDDQIGMAPGATWMACRACSFLECGDAELLACGQFIMAPWDLGGNNSDPDKRPHIVNNSWGDCEVSYDDWYQNVVDNWHAAGIYPVFSNGNSSNCNYPSPPGLGTVGNPARYGNVTGVGSTGLNDGQYAPHSNWGPTDDADTVNPNGGYDDLKPQVVAPGVNIRSSGNLSDDDYYSSSGTSMSAPHVAGLVALMWDAAPCLIGDYATTETIIENTARPIPYTTGELTDVPNYATGWGEIDALAAVEAAVATCPFWLEVRPEKAGVCTPDDAVLDVDVIRADADFTGSVPLQVTGQPTDTVVVFSPASVVPTGSSQLTISNTVAAAAGSYQIRVGGVTPTYSYTTTATLDLFTTMPTTPTLVSPSDGAAMQPITPTLVWQAVAQGSTYEVQIARDRDFSDIVESAVGLSATAYTPRDLKSNTDYYWRVRASNGCGFSAYSETSGFTTTPLPGECSGDNVNSVLFREDFEGGDGMWTHGFNSADGVLPIDTWAITDTHSYSGGFAFHARNVNQVSDQYLISPELSLPWNSELLTLQFWHDRDIESRIGGGCYDGAILEVSSGKGADWTQVGTEALLTDPYDGQIDTRFNNPLAGQPAWCGNSEGWTRAVVDLGAYAGQSLRFRFRIATDGSFGREGWYVDEVQVKSCLSVQGSQLYLPLVSNVP